MDPEIVWLLQNLEPRIQKDLHKEEHLSEQQENAVSSGENESEDGAAGYNIQWNLNDQFVSSSINDAIGSLVEEGIEAPRVNQQTKWDVDDKPAASSVNRTFSNKKQYYLSISQLEFHWKMNMSPFVREKVKEFFRGPGFFVDYHDLDFYIGKNQKDGQYHILLDEVGIKTVYEDIVAISEISFSLPSLSKHSRNWSDIELIETKMSTPEDFWLVIRHLKSLNRSAKLSLSQEVPLCDYAQMERFLLKSKKLYIISVDVECWEVSHDIILEIGWTIYERNSSPKESCTGKITDKHYIIREHTGYKNGKYVDDARNRFGFGDSFKTSLNDAKKAFQEDFSRANVLVGHSLKSDIEWLTKHVGVTIPKKAGENTLKMVDTNSLWISKYHKPAGDSISVKNLMKLLEIRQDFPLHNAGNDAHYTMMCFLKMMDLS